MLKGQNPDVNIEAVNNTIVFTSRRFGENSSVTIQTASGENITDIYGETYLNGASAQTTPIGDIISIQVDLRLREYTGKIPEDDETEKGFKKK